jgi:hypothetical protein
VVMESLESLSLQELTDRRCLAEAGRLSLSSAEYLSLVSEIAGRWSELRSLCWVGGPAAEALSGVFAMRRAKCMSAGFLSAGFQSAK